ncbi:MAG: lysylphosphatidylglycerol synthase domain-containing protein [Gemmataceae bacterium]
MTRRRLLLVGKGLLAAVLIGAVGWHFARLLNAPELWEHPPVARPAYLAAAGVLYLLAHTLWATFFVQLLWNQRADVSWRLGVRAYFVSQFGKYVPGKAWVIVLRVLLLRPAGVDHGVVAVTGVYETLTSMAAGAILGVCLLPWAGIGLDLGPAAWVGLLAVATMPLSAGVINKLAARLVLKRRGSDGKPLPSPSLRLLVRGLLQDAVGWCLLGLSLWATVTGLTLGDGELTPGRYLQDLAATALSYVAGFVFMFSPGGLGAREFVLQRVLTAQLGDGPAAAAQAAVVAIVVRMVWTGFEVVFAGMLYLLVKPARGTHD